MIREKTICDFTSEQIIKNINALKCYFEKKVLHAVWQKKYLSIFIYGKDKK